MEDIHSFVKRPFLSPETIECLNIIPDFPLETKLETRDVLREYIIDGVIERNNNLIDNFSDHIQKINNSFDIINKICQQCTEMENHVRCCKEDTSEMTTRMKNLEIKKKNLNNNLNNINCIIEEFIISPQEDEILNAGQPEDNFFNIISKLEKIIRNSVSLPDSNLKNEIIEIHTQKLKNACITLQKSVEEIVNSVDFSHNFTQNDNLETNLKTSFSILHENKINLDDLWENIVSIRRERILMDFIATISNICGDSHLLVENLLNWLEKGVNIEIKLLRLHGGKQTKELLNRVTIDILNPLKDKIEQYIFSLSDFVPLMKVYQSLKATLSNFLNINFAVDSRPVKLFKTLEESVELSKNIFFNSLIHHCCMLLSGSCPKDLVPCKTLTDAVFAFKSVVSEPLTESDKIFCGKLIESAIKVLSVTSCDLDKVSCAAYSVNFYCLLNEICHFNEEKAEMVANLIDTGVDNLASLQAQFVLESSKLMLFYQLLNKDPSDWPMDVLAEAASGIENILKNYSVFTYPKFSHIKNTKIRTRFMKLSLLTILRIYEDVYSTLVKSGGMVERYLPLTVEQLKELVVANYFV